MIKLDIHLDGDNCWPDLREKGCVEGTLESVAALPRGTLSGLPTVTLRVRLPDGQVVLAETTLNLFLSAAAAFKGRYGQPL